MEKAVNAAGPAKSTSSRRRAGTLAKVACLGCRRLKMKCITEFEGAPCLRCAKAKRACVQPLVTQSNKQISSANATPPETPLQTPSLYSAGAGESTWTLSPDNQRRSISRSYTSPELTTTRWSSPSSSVANGMFDSSNSLHGLGLSFDQFNAPSKAPSRDEQNPATSFIIDNSLNGDTIPLEELRHLDQFFISNLLTHVRVISDEDVSDLTVLIERKRSLAISMAYVAAHFVPGCKTIRTRLTPAVASLATSYLHTHASNPEVRWTILQALAVLYTWAPIQTDDIFSGGRNELTRDMLRMTIESMAVRFSLHRSAQDAAEALKNIAAPEEACKSFAVRKYTFWLWLYTESHLNSLVTRSPPTLREDASITHASKILARVLSNRHIQRVVTVVELCLVWARTDLSQRDLGEWYCSTPNHLAPETAAAMLNQMDESLITWRQHWAQPSKVASNNQVFSEILSATSLSLHQHFLHFCNALYIAQAFRASSVVDTNPSSLAGFEGRALERALALCNFFRGLSPLAKSVVGLSPEIVFVMVAFCCRYITQSLCTTSCGPNGGWLDEADTVLAVADLMIEVGGDDARRARIIGQRILGDYLSIKTLAPNAKEEASNSYDTRPGLHPRAHSTDLLNLPALIGGGSHNSIREECDSGRTSGSVSPQYQTNMMSKSWSHDTLSHCDGLNIASGLSPDNFMDILQPMTVGDGLNTVDNLAHESMWITGGKFSPAGSFM